MHHFIHIIHGTTYKQLIVYIYLSVAMPRLKLSAAVEVGHVQRLGLECMGVI